ncbi:MAG TPA: hypothetical protein VNL97_05505 [Solirubrobacterales bacterium]|nr:hypothetical protein [Solirubrobacterales bacterium]
MSRRPAGALAGIAMILSLAAPAGAAAVGLAARTSLEVPHPQVPLRDAVIQESGRSAARISATASSQRYPIHDGSDATIAVSVTAACAENCEVKDPQRVADFVGTLIHGDEASLLSVQLDTEFQLGYECGFGAEACYFSGDNRVVIGGYEEADGDGATFDFVLAHEYGHHVAQHRDMAPPFRSAIDWGTERWATVENVCRGRRAGKLFPGDEGSHYFEDPGEAFAESFARYRFPEMRIAWRYAPSLRPSRASFRAIREDTLSPWRGRTSFTLSGRLPARGEGAAVESLRTPLDGTVSLRPGSLSRHGYELALRSRAGRLLRNSHHGLGPRHELDFTVCGQKKLSVVITPTRRHPTPFELHVRRP